MSSVTALELINRVNLFRRVPVVSSFNANDPEQSVTLNALNMAKEDILGTRRWEFDLRHDGQLVTKAIATGTFEITAGSSSAFVSGFTNSEDLGGDFVVRLLPTGVTNYANTAFRASNASTTSFGFLNLAVPFPETVTAGTACSLIYAEYILPDTVREVVRASYQEDEMDLDLIDPTLGFDEWVPNAHVDSGEPRRMAIGGYDVRTYYQAGASFSQEPGLRAIVWPPPDDEYVINYSYYKRHADFTTGTDTLVGVPPSVVHQVVLQALSYVKMAVDGDYAGSHFGDLAQTQASVLKANYGGSQSRRHTVRSWDSSSNRIAIQLGFPNKVIGP